MAFRFSLLTLLTLFAFTACGGDSPKGPTDLGPEFADVIDDQLDPSDLAPDAPDLVQPDSSDLSLDQTEDTPQEVADAGDLTDLTDLNDLNDLQDLVDWAELPPQDLVDTDDLPDLPPGPATIHADFPSGNISVLARLDDQGAAWSLAIRSDNDSTSFPANWRTWWYFRIDNARTDVDTQLNIGAHGWFYDYLPIYSYDQENWVHFAPTEVRLNGTVLEITKRFTAPTVWVARFFPYTHADLAKYLDSIDGHPALTRTQLGLSSQNRSIEMLTITSPAPPSLTKQRIWMHARTHPGETGPSYLLEGLIDFLLSDDPDAITARQHFIFNLVPMHNPDGVEVGNYRTTPGGSNLEVGWLRQAGDPWQLQSNAPHEVQLLRDTIAGFYQGANTIPVSVALNLHSSNAEPATGVFFFPHFGSTSLGYTAEQAQLWTDQINLINDVARRYEGRVEPGTNNNGYGFVSNAYPESWWWANFGAAVNAITLETVYGQAGFEPRWVDRGHLRSLGVAVGMALLDYHGIPTTRRFKAWADATFPWQPGRPLPGTEDELKM